MSRYACMNNNTSARTDCVALTLAVGLAITLLSPIVNATELTEAPKAVVPPVPTPAKIGGRTVVYRPADYDKPWEDPKVEQRIRDGIQANRMGSVTFRFVDESGNPLTNVEVAFEQKRHDFLFGCNLFKLQGFSTPEENRLYEERFCELFNFAYLPFFWSDLEPEQGKPRFAKDSRPIFRRPPPDLTLEFCEQHHITPIGHILMYHAFFPKWLPQDKDEMKRLMVKRFEEISARYGQRIKYWDLCAETLNDPSVLKRLPDDYEYFVCQAADQAFPKDSVFSIGQTVRHSFEKKRLDQTFSWLETLKSRQARFDVIEMQGNMFGIDSQQYSPTFHPLNLFETLDKYSKFKKPLVFDQIQISGLPVGPKGEEDQAVAARNLYRLFFSHPSIQSIGWWNLDGGKQFGNEAAWEIGLLRADFSPKPVYLALKKLIREEWWTKLATNSGSSEVVKLQGFYGKYQLTAKKDGKIVQREIHLSKNGNNSHEIVFR